MGSIVSDEDRESSQPSLAQFFRELPKGDGVPSRFTATQVAALIREDRDAAD